ncbi:hypothetical protein B7494_g1465 [Chlorociboria aeruginascens]|nr:hypothetical protein B7494_g1465 [Chlorociboria aeruginascens]
MSEKLVIRNNEGRYKRTFPPPSMEIIVKTTYGKDLHILLGHNDTIRSLKSYICHIEGIPINRQRLFLNQYLDDDATVHSSSLFHGCTIYLVVNHEDNPDHLKQDLEDIFTACETLYVSIINGKTLTLSVKESYTIARVKMIIEKALSIPPQDQVLIFGGTELEDQETLSGQRIRNHSTIEAFPRTEEVAPKPPVKPHKRQQKTVSWRDPLLDIVIEPPRFRPGIPKISTVTSPKRNGPIRMVRNSGDPRVGSASGNGFGTPGESTRGDKCHRKSAFNAMRKRFNDFYYSYFTGSHRAGVQRHA